MVTNVCVSKCGKLVQFSGSIKPKSTMAPWTRILSGTPAPINSGSNIFLTALDAGQNADTAIKLYIDINTGDMYARSGKTSVTTDFSWTYIAK